MKSKLTLALCLFFFIWGIRLWPKDNLNPSDRILLSPTFSGSLIVPVGLHSQFAEIGAGTGLGIELKNLLFSQSILKCGFGFSSVEEKLGISRFMGFTVYDFDFGISLPLTKQLEIIPLIGGGYLGHIALLDKTRFYFDPLLKFQLELSLNIHHNFAIYIRPSYNLFFQQSDFFSFLSFHIGIKDGIHLFSPSKGPLQGGLEILPHTKNFSPNEDGIKDILTLAPKLDGEVKAYEINIKNDQGDIVKKIKKEEIKTCKWNGYSDDNRKLSDGAYMAELIVYKEFGKKVLNRTEVVLDTQAPNASLKLSDTIISPDNDGTNDTITFAVHINGNDAISSWNISISDRMGNLFYQQENLGRNQLPFTWNGRSNSGERVMSSEEYRISIQIQDLAGNVTKLSEVIKSDIMVIENQGRFKVIVPSIIFQGYSSDYNFGPSKQVEKNNAILDRLAEILKKYQGYSLIIKGYAINESTGSSDDMAKENLEELIPLSWKRAESIQKALKERGLESFKILTIGKGNANPVVPLNDKKNQWKNRRVEFLLEK